MARIQWRIPLFVMKKEDMGMARSAIITFEKKEMLFSTRVLSEKESREKGHDVESYSVQFGYVLVIDLWIVIIRFNWKGVNELLK